MPHIHTKPGQIDFTVEVFIVHADRVLLRKHDKLGFWLSVGGHIELDEDPVEAAVREVAEEVGLSIQIDDSHMLDRECSESYRALVPPVFMCRMGQGPGHEHVTLTYFARSETNEVRPSGADRSDAWRWFAKSELSDPEFDLGTNIETYARTALERLR